MPFNIPKGGSGISRVGGGDRKVLEEIRALYWEIQEQGERLTRIEQRLTQLEQNVQSVLITVRSLRG